MDLCRYCIYTNHGFLIRILHSLIWNWLLNETVICLKAFLRISLTVHVSIHNLKKLVIQSWQILVAFLLVETKQMECFQNEVLEGSIANWNMNALRPKHLMPVAAYRCRSRPAEGQGLRSFSINLQRSFSMIWITITSKRLEPAREMMREYFGSLALRLCLWYLRKKTYQ